MGAGRGQREKVLEALSQSSAIWGIPVFSPQGFVEQKRQPFLTPDDKQGKEPKTPQNLDGLKKP